MIVLDLNLLLYAVNADAPEHAAAKTFLEDVLSDAEPVGLPWIVIVGFIRVATNRRIFARPLPLDTALGIVDGWVQQPNVIAISPSDAHWTVFRDVLDRSARGGDWATDAHLAAIAIEHGAELCSTDSDFARFKELRWRNPLT